MLTVEMKREEKFYDIQEQRVKDFIKNCKYKNDMDIDEFWCNYLEENFKFPFEAEIVDDQGSLEIGDVIKITAIVGVFDLYGIVVKARKGRRQYSFPLCLLELVEKNSSNYQLVDDYNFWFCNR